MEIFVTGVVLFGAVAGLVLVFNRFVRLRAMVSEAWSGIDVQLMRRAALVPNLVEAVKGYLGHERNVLTEIAALRSRSLQSHTVGERGVVEMALSRSLGNLLAVAENYPDLQASQNFLALQKELADIEDQIQMARRYYNGTVRNLNIAVESFPGNLVAKLFRFAPAEFFSLEDAGDRQVPRASLGVSK